MKISLENLKQNIAIYSLIQTFRYRFLYHLTHNRIIERFDREEGQKSSKLSKQFLLKEPYFRFLDIQIQVFRLSFIFDILEENILEKAISIIKGIQKTIGITIQKVSKESLYCFQNSKASHNHYHNPFWIFIKIKTVT